MLTIVVFILILGLLVLAHEFGHFITARKSGMRVFEFGFGFPPRAFGVYYNPGTGKWTWVWGKGKRGLKDAVAATDDEEDVYPTTMYSINWLPLGGFVRIKGENGEKANEVDSFGAQKAWKRATVLAAGVFMNILLAAVLLSIGFMSGLPTDASAGLDRRAVMVTPPRVMAQMVEKNSPAEVAGIKFGDELVGINGAVVTSSAQFVALVKENGAKELQLNYRRSGVDMTATTTPKVLRVTDGAPRLGIMLADATVVRYPWYIAIVRGFIGAFVGLANIFISFWLLLKNLFLGQGLAFDVSGPVGIAVLVGQSARLGFSYLLNITAMISLSLAAINILPIPALDGGRLLFILIEKIIKRPVPQKYEQAAHTVGFILLMILIVVVTGRDILGLLH